MHRSRPMLPEIMTCQHVVEGRIRSLLLVVAWAALLASSTRAASLGMPQGKANVSLRESCTVHSTDVYLADLAEITADEAVLSEALKRVFVGSLTGERVWPRSELEAIVRTAVPAPADIRIEGADWVRGTLATRAPARTEMEQAVRAYLGAVTPYQPAEIEIRSSNIPDRAGIPEGEVVLQISSRAIPPDFSQMLLPVEATLGGRTLRTFWIQVSARVQARIVRAARRISYRQILEAGDVEEAIVDIRNPRAAYVRSLAEAVGSVAKRSLVPGEPVQREWLAGRDLVRSGDTVRAHSQGNGIHLSVTVRALQSGKLGSVVWVRNLDSKRALKARVTGPGEVSIQR